MDKPNANRDATNTTAENAIDPNAEDAYWRDNYKTRPYATSGASYEQFRPAYQYGWESAGRYRGRKFGGLPHCVIDRFFGSARERLDRESQEIEIAGMACHCRLGCLRHRRFEAGDLFP